MDEKDHKLIMMIYIVKLMRLISNILILKTRTNNPQQKHVHEPTIKRIKIQMENEIDKYPNIFIIKIYMLLLI